MSPFSQTYSQNWNFDYLSKIISFSFTANMICVYTGFLLALRNVKV